VNGATRMLRNLLEKCFRMVLWRVENQNQAEVRGLKFLSVAVFSIVSALLAETAAVDLNYKSLSRNPLLLSRRPATGRQQITMWDLHGTHPLLYPLSPAHHSSMLLGTCTPLISIIIST